MSLATSCPTCGTVFKVVEDQLKVSEGWVRCGHCQVVFNALEGLFDLQGRQRPAESPGTPDPASTRTASIGSSGGAGPSAARSPNSGQAARDSRGEWIETRPAMFSDVRALRERQLEREAEQRARLAKPEVTPPATETQNHLPGTASDAPIAPRSTQSPALDPLPASPQSGTVDAFIADPLEAPVEAVPQDAAIGHATPFAEASAPRAGDGAEAHHEDDFMADTVFLPHESSRFFDDAPSAQSPMPPIDDEPAWPAPATTVRDEFVRNAVPVPPASGASPVGGSSMAMPDFVRVADRAAWWSRPAVRATLGVLGILFAITLALQFGLHHRDLVVARWPQFGPAIQALCEPLGCELRAPRMLDALVVESSSLTRPAGVDGYRLQVLLRNRATHPVLAPHLELSLTDGTGAVIIRRVLTPSEFRQPDQLQPSSEGNWQLEMTSADKRIAGFTVAAFYP